MKSLQHTYSAILCAILLGFVPLAHAQAPVVLTAEDGVTVYGDLHAVEADKTAPVVLLFHQGGANARAEYTNIIPRLTAQGYHVLAIDQRQGGDRLGGHNRTVDALPADAPTYGYCDAYPDLKAALQYVIDEGYTGKRIVWGSSYSAALVIQLAYQYDNSIIDGVLAFSPASGDSMAGCLPETYLSGVGTAMLAFRPEREMEIESVQRQQEVFAEAGFTVHVIPQGVHGSSMLNPDRAPEAAVVAWPLVLAFIEGVVDAQ